MEGATGQALYQQVLDSIAPLSGAIVARATLEHQVAEMGLTPETLAARHIPDLADRVSRGLSMFIGPDLAGRARQSIKSLG